jgi:hypothetical protein
MPASVAQQLLVPEDLREAIKEAVVKMLKKLWIIRV